MGADGVSQHGADHGCADESVCQSTAVCIALTKVFHQQGTDFVAGKQHVIAVVFDHGAYAVAVRVSGDDDVSV